MIRQALSVNEALSQAMRYASRKECNSHQMMQKMMSWGCSEDDARNIIEELTEKKFIDDRRYAEAFVKDKFRLSKWGRIKIGYMLRMQGISDQVAGDAIAGIDRNEYLQLLKDELAKKSKSMKARSQVEMKGKLYRFAVSRGFEPDIVHEATHIFMNE